MSKKFQSTDFSDLKKEIELERLKQIKDKKFDKTILKDELDYLSLDLYKKKLMFDTQPMSFTTKLKDQIYYIEDIPKKDLLNILKSTANHYEIDKCYSINDNFHPVVNAFLYNLENNLILC